MSEITVGMCRAARGFLGWTQVDLAEKSGLGRATITAFEGGSTSIAPRSLRDIVAAFEAAGVLFTGPAEGIHQGVVALRWGVPSGSAHPNPAGWGD